MSRTKPAPSIPPFKFRDEEIAALADMAWKAWETGSEHASTDRLGGVWKFLPERTNVTSLTVARDYQGAVEAFRVSGLELGVDEVRAMLASRILGLVEPHVGRRNAEKPAPLE